MRGPEGTDDDIHISAVDYHNQVRETDDDILVERTRVEYQARITSAESLGRVLAQARMLHGLSQRELADRLGTTQRYIWEIEAGKPSIFTERLFAYLRETDTELTATVREPEDRSTPAESEGAADG